MNSLGRTLRLTVFGQSHSPAIGCVLEGLPAGIAIDEAALQAFMARRAPGQGTHTTARHEQDRPQVLSGLNAHGTTSGAPLALLIANGDTRPQDYEALGKVPRPSHVDWVAWQRWGEAWDRSGSGQFSGRLTAALCAAGGVCAQWLATCGIAIGAHLARIGAVEDEPLLARDPADAEALAAQIALLARGGRFPTLGDAAAEAMLAAIDEARRAGDSVGGIVEVAAQGVPEGLGDPMFRGLENALAQGFFAIPAVKGVEFGRGFDFAGLRGSEANDPFEVADGAVRVAKNDCGGILGGISTGAPVVARLAFKPTPSIARAQRSVDLERLEPVELAIRGRHDPCVCVRAVPVVEAVTALVLGDFMLDAPTHRA